MRQVIDSVSGSLAGDKALLYEVTQCENFCIRSVILISNEEDEAVSAEIWVTRGAIARRVIPRTNLQPMRDAQELTFIPLRIGDRIEGYASLPDKVDYWIGYAMDV